MTEDDAKTKWCPFVRSGMTDVNGSPVNRWAANPTDSGVADYYGDDKELRIRWNKCIGSACMAWRYTNKSAMHDRKRWIDTQDKTADEAYAEYLTDFPLEGRCGLAGA